MSFKMFMDEHGIPYSDYGVYRGLEIGRQRSILSVAERALWYWNTWALGEDKYPPLLSYNWTKYPANKEFDPKEPAEAQRMLLNCADWLLENLEHHETHAVWRYAYEISYGTPAGWVSGHTQAVGMQALARAYELTGDQRYIATIDALLAAYQLPIAEGGLVEVLDDGQPWFEKVASPHNQKPKVLNGMMFALLGLLDIAQRLGKPVAADLAGAGQRTLLHMLPKFDLGDWSAYDIMGRRASPHYHAIHTQQLERLHVMTANPAFLDWRERFLAQKGIVAAPQKSLSPPSLLSRFLSWTVRR